MWSNYVSKSQKWRLILKHLISLVLHPLHLPHLYWSHQDSLRQQKNNPSQIWEARQIKIRKKVKAFRANQAKINNNQY